MVYAYFFDVFNRNFSEFVELEKRYIFPIIFPIISVGVSITIDGVLKLDFLPPGDGPKTSILLDQAIWQPIVMQLVQNFPTGIAALDQMLASTISLNTTHMIEVAPQFNQIKAIQPNFSYGIKSFGEMLAETAVDDILPNHVEIELSQGSSITFCQDMWHNFQYIMRNKYARVLQVAEQFDRISEINSLASLFSNEWFIGLHPISRYSLVWDFNRYEDDCESSEISHDDSNDLDDTVSADVSSSSSDDDWGDPMSPSVLERRLFDLYNKNESDI